MAGADLSAAIRALEATAGAWRLLASTVDRGASATLPGPVHVAATGVLGSGYNAAIVTGEPHDPAAAAAETISFFARSALPFEVNIPLEWTPTIDAYTDAGLSTADPSPVMILDDPAGLAVPEPHASMARVSGSDGWMAATEALSKAFGSPAEEVRRFLPEAMRMHPGVDIVVAAVDGKPAATAMSITDGDAIGIFAVGTTPDARRRGLGASCTAEAVRAGVEKGGTWAYLQASPLGEPVYRRMGFREAVRTTALQWTPPQAC